MEYSTQSWTKKIYTCIYMPICFWEYSVWSAWGPTTLSRTSEGPAAKIPLLGGLAANNDHAISFYIQVLNSILRADYLFLINTSYLLKVQI